MKITLRSFAHYAGMSEETIAFRAVIVINGTPSVEAHNSGHGEANRLDPIKGQTRQAFEDALDALRAYAKELPPITMEGHAPFPHDLDSAVSHVVSLEIARRDMRRALKSKLVYVDGAGRLMQTSYTLRGSRKRAPVTPELIQQHLAKYPDHCVLNAMDEERAFTLWTREAK